MSKKIRDYLFIVFIVCFILGTILISLYASGFQINFTWPPTGNRLLTRTGMILIRTNPEGAIVYLNNHPQSEFSLNPWKTKYLSTPTRIKNVLPGDYKLNLKLKDYLTLTKKITVYSGQTTFAEDINLFRSDLPQLIATSSDSKLGLSSNHKYLYLSSNPKIITVLTGQSKNLQLAPNSIGVWLKNSDQLFVAGRLFNLVDNTSLNYQKILGPSANNFYYDENQNRLYYQSGSSLNYLDLNNNANILVLSGGDYLTYEVRANNIFLVNIKNGQTLLQVYSLKTKKIEQEAKLPKVGRYVFIPENYSRLNLYDSQNKTLYLINPLNIRQDEKTIHNVISWQWRNEQTLFYSNNWEIYRLNLQQNRSTLLTRIGKKIIKIVWNSHNNYLIFFTSSSINAYDPKVALSTEIFKTNKIANPILDDANNTLYFWAKVGRQSGVYKLLLQ